MLRLSIFNTSETKSLPPPFMSNTVLLFTNRIQYSHRLRQSGGKFSLRQESANIPPEGTGTLSLYFK
jgi:hypothetical protein